jgi:hypothetical protein
MCPYSPVATEHHASSLSSSADPLFLAAPTGVLVFALGAQAIASAKNAWRTLVSLSNLAETRSVPSNFVQIWGLLGLRAHNVSGLDSFQPLPLARHVALGVLLVSKRARLAQLFLFGCNYMNHSPSLTPVPSLLRSPIINYVNSASNSLSHTGRPTTDTIISDK